MRVAICDDSRTYSHALKRFLEHDGDIEVIGVHPTAEALLRSLARNPPDLITMDLELPGIDGVAATERIVSGKVPVPVVVLSAHVTPGSERAAAALAGGAVEAILKGELPLTDAGGAAAAAVRRRLRRLARARVQPLPRLAARTPRPVARRVGQPVAAVGLAASTGGPQTLAVVLAALPADFAIPIVVVQHMSAGFTPGLATWLDRQSPLPVRLATPGTVAGPGVWFAPEGAHTTLDADMTIRRDIRTTGSRHVPSADALFTGMARSLSAAAAAVVLTGLGRDGAAGVRAILAAGGLGLAQDEASAVVSGMPGAAAAVGARVLALDEIAGALRRLTPAMRP
jgi:two-component system chemotaxis response regulator CheB